MGINSEYTSQHKRKKKTKNGLRVVGGSSGSIVRSSNLRFQTLPSVYAPSVAKAIHAKPGFTSSNPSSGFYVGPTQVSGRRWASRGGRKQYTDEEKHMWGYEQKRLKFEREQASRAKQDVAGRYNLDLPPAVVAKKSRSAASGSLSPVFISTASNFSQVDYFSPQPRYVSESFSRDGVSVSLPVDYNLRGRYGYIEDVMSFRPKFYMLVGQYAVSNYHNKMYKFIDDLFKRYRPVEFKTSDFKNSFLPGEIKKFKELQLKLSYVLTNPISVFNESYPRDITSTFESVRYVDEVDRGIKSKPFEFPYEVLSTFPQNVTYGQLVGADPTENVDMPIWGHPHVDGVDYKENPVKRMEEVVEPDVIDVDKVEVIDGIPQLKAGQNDRVFYDDDDDDDVEVADVEVDYFKEVQPIVEKIKEGKPIIYKSKQQEVIASKKPKKLVKGQQTLDFAKEPRRFFRSNGRLLSVPMRIENPNTEIEAAMPVSPIERKAVEQKIEAVRNALGVPLEPKQVMDIIKQHTRVNKVDKKNVDAKVSAIRKEIIGLREKVLNNVADSARREGIEISSDASWGRSRHVGVYIENLSEELKLLHPDLYQPGNREGKHILNRLMKLERDQFGAAISRINKQVYGVNKEVRAAKPQREVKEVREVGETSEEHKRKVENLMRFLRPRPPPNGIITAEPPATNANHILEGEARLHDPRIKDVDVFFMVNPKDKDEF